MFDAQWPSSRTILGIIFNAHKSPRPAEYNSDHEGEWSVMGLPGSSQLLGMCVVECTSDMPPPFLNGTGHIQDTTV